MALGEREYRNAIGLFPTGVAVIVAQVANEVLAMTVNSVASLSLAPTLIMFAPGKHTRFARHLDALNSYSINILRSEQQALSTYFAGGWKGSTAPPFRFVPAGNALRLEGALVSLECASAKLTEVGDHWMVIGEVVGVHRGLEPHAPLVFYKGRYGDIDASQSAPAPDLADAHDIPAHIWV
jgi:flavin reductase (DIM6/NTAB) family NADH-FMN oxidoreductase RutF